MSLHLVLLRKQERWRLTQPGSDRLPTLLLSQKRNR
jgi:hypothetical protein